MGRFNTLYLGSDPKKIAGKENENITHLQIIQIIPRPLADLEWILSDWEEYTYVLFTSKHAVRIFFDLLKTKGLYPKHSVIAVGETTSTEAKKYGWKKTLCAQNESQEGVLELLRKIRWNETDYILMPKSSIARGSILNFFLEHNLRHQVCNLYDTIPKKVSFPDLEQFDQIYFSSPSTVTAFFSQVTQLPKNPKLIAIGPVTWQNLIRAINILETSKGEP